MKAFFEAIENLFVNYIFGLHDILRKLELENWWAANTVSWIFVIICCIAFGYWMKQLKIFNDSGEEENDISAHSYL
ncbi:MAG: uracil phosphoribosyltransferase [Cellulophaga sp.]